MNEKTFPALICLTISLLLFGCNHTRESRKAIEKAETLIEASPDSALAILKSISQSEELPDKLYARWCMLHGKIADTLEIDLPPVSTLSRAYLWYIKHGTDKEKAQSGLYLGRVHAQDKDYEKAMQAYLQALNYAMQAQAYNLAGYISSYMGDAYEFDDVYPKSFQQFTMASQLFNQSGNIKSEAYALRDAGRSLLFMDSIHQAMEYISQADSLFTLLDFKEGRSQMAAYKGKIYSLLEKYDLSEKYYLEAIKSDTTSIAQYYASLASLYLNTNDIGKAGLYLDSAKCRSNDPYFLAGITYYEAQLKKKTGHSVEAIDLLEKYVAFSDSYSIKQAETELLTVEGKYNQEKLIAENRQLVTFRQRNQLLAFLLASICLSLAVIYLLHIIRKNKKIYLQTLDIEIKDKEILSLSLQLEQKVSDIKLKQSQFNAEKEVTEDMKKELSRFKKESLLSSSIGKRLVKLSEKIIPGQTASLISNKDWEQIEKLVNALYPSFPLFINKSDLSIAEKENCLLSLFDFSIQQESILLSINIDSASKRRSRLRKRLGITSTSINLYDYLTTNKEADSHT